MIKLFLAPATPAALAGALLVASLAAPTIAMAQESNESVLLVKMSYAEGRWQARPTAVLPCGAPSKPDSTAESRSVYRLRGRDGRVLFQHYITNPRIVLVENPKEAPPLRKAMEFTLRIPLAQDGRRPLPIKDIGRFEFLENSRGQEGPSVVLPLENDLPALVAEQAKRKDRPACSVRAPDLRKLPPLPAMRDAGDAISPESFAMLLRNDKGLVMRWGIEHKVRPEELRRLVERNQKQVAAMRFDKPAVERLLREYELAWKRRGRKD